jgi:hypothetical protein
MKLRHLTVVLAGAGALLAVAAPASAAPARGAVQIAPSSMIKVTGPVVMDRLDPRVASIPAVYRCTGEGELWASVKQTADRSQDPRLQEEGSSSISAAWSDSHRNALVCDGVQHKTTFSVDQLEPFVGLSGPVAHKSDGFGPLAPGFGYVQLCLFDDLNPYVPVSNMVFQRVVAPYFVSAPLG